MAEVERGTLILADQVYKTTEGKWVIAGTYTNWRTNSDSLSIPTGLLFYIRILPDSAGVRQMRLVLTDETLDPRDERPPLLNHRFPLTVHPGDVPVYQGKMHIQNFAIECPIPFAKRAPGSVYKMAIKARLFVEEHEVAYCPLDFLFFGPQVKGNEQDHPRSGRPE